MIFTSKNVISFGILPLPKNLTLPIYGGRSGLPEKQVFSEISI